MGEPESEAAITDSANCNAGTNTIESRDMWVCHPSHKGTSVCREESRDACVVILLHMDFLCGLSSSYPRVTKWVSSVLSRLNCLDPVLTNMRHVAYMENVRKSCAAASNTDHSHQKGVHCD